MIQPVVSICMITYGHEKFIEKAINGVLMQETNFTIELVLANDGSPDLTDSIVQKIILNHPKASIIKYINRTKNIGMMPNFVEALKSCNGKYIAMCEGDDYWIDPFKLQKQVDFLESNSEYVLTFHDVKILKPNGKLVSDFITKVPENYETQETLARLGNYIHTPSVVYRNVIQSYPDNFQKSPVGDYFLYLLLSDFGKLKYLKEEMAVYRFGVGFFSKIDEISKRQKWIESLELINKTTGNAKIIKIIQDRILNSTEDLNKLIAKRDKKSLSNFIKKQFLKLKSKI